MKVKTLLLLMCGLALIILGFAMPPTRRLIRILETPVLILGGFAAGYAFRQWREGQ